MAPPNSSMAYFREGLRFIKQNFKKLWWAFSLPVIGAVAILWGVLHYSMALVTWLTSLIARPDWVPEWLVDVGSGIFGSLLAIVLMYLLFIPLVRLCLTPLLGIYAEKIYFIRTEKSFDTTQPWHPRFWRNQAAAILGALLLALYQLPLKLVAWFLALVIPGGFIVSIAIEFMINRHFVAVDNFGVLLMAGPKPIVRPYKLKKALEPLHKWVKGYKTWGGLLLCIPVVNVFFLLLNITTATLIIADHGGPELQSVE